SPDSARTYRRSVAAEFLPYGVTLVRDVGSDTSNYALLRAWMTRSPDAPDFLPADAALVSPGAGRVIPPFHVAVLDSADAPAAVGKRPGAGMLYIAEQWRILGDDDPRVSALIERLRATRSTLTPTLGVIAKGVGLSTLETPPAGVFDDVRAFTPAQRARALEGY